MNRQSRRQQSQQAERRRRREPRRGAARDLRSYLMYGIGGLAAVVIVAAVAYALYTQFTQVPPEEDDSPDLPGQYYAPQGNQHLPVGETYDGYTSTPPTSGPHSEQAAPPGIYREPIPKEVLVHSMEHGTVLLLYRCPDGCDQLRAQLEAVALAYGEQEKLVLVAPYPEMDATIALVAWTRLDTLEAFDEARVRRFIDAHERRYNPEGF